VVQPKPSASDPIVGRIAFWTDDETCKVNINTASVGKNTTTTTPPYGFKTPTIVSGVVNSGTESSFWDTPRSYTPQDFGYAYSQPVQNEFQRYPGHPATVDLSAVFNGWTADANFPEDVYQITPRVISGGSQEGTQPALTQAANPLIPLTLRSTPLYTTLDELLFHSQQILFPTMGSHQPDK